MRSAAAMAIILASALGASPAHAADEPAQPVFNIMGPSDCARWPSRARLDSAAKAVPLNWALGFLSGVAERGDAKLFDLVEPETISGWLDSYCLEHPTDTLPAAVRVLGKELEAQLPPPPPPMFFTPPPAPTPAPAKAAPAKAPAKAAPAKAPAKAAPRPAPRPATAARPRPAPAPAAPPVLRR